MVYLQAFRKTAGFIILSMVLSFGIIILTSSSDLPTGRVTTEGVVTDIASGTWTIFLLGVFIGALLIWTYFYIAHIEAKRKE